MSFRNKLPHFLVKKLGISNKEVMELLIAKRIKVNGKVTSANVGIEPEDEVMLDNTIIQASKEFKYIAFYKPAGIETTLNEDIADSLKSLLPFEGIFPVGRLDKASEGLMLLTDDGRLYDKTLRKEFKTEKEYLVKVDKCIDSDFVENMQNGITIMGKKTLPCKVRIESDFWFKIILVQGLNRQIRRMCYKLGYEVEVLKRIRMGGVSVGDLKAGAWRFIKKQDIFEY